MPQYITMFHIRFHRHQLFSNRHRENKTTPTFATSAGEPGQISRNYPTETCSTLRRCSNTEPDGLCSYSIMLYPKWRSSNNQVARRNKLDISCPFEVITIIITPPRNISLLQAFIYTSSSRGIIHPGVSIWH